MFPHLVDAAVALDPDARVFIVDDVRRVVVPGLIELRSVNIDGAHMPVMEPRSMWKQEPGKEPETFEMDVPLVIHQDVPGVGPCLIRSEYSNHGVWQLGSTVTVTGKWADGPSEHFVSNLDAMKEIERARSSAVAETEQRLQADIEGSAAMAKEAEEALKAKDNEIAELRSQLEAAGKAEVATGDPAAPTGAEQAPAETGQPPSEPRPQGKKSRKEAE